MTRSKGRHAAPRQPQAQDIDPNSPEGRQLGMSSRTQGVPSPIPGGRQHLSNAPAVRETVPTAPPEPEIGMLNAHGVPPGSHTNAERADHERGPNTVHGPVPQHHPHVEQPAPIPVYVVQDHRAELFRSAAPHNFTVPGTGSDPVRICGRDMTRTEVQVLNESTAQNIRIAQRPADLTNGGGGLIPWPTNSYTTIKTQDELWALSTSGTAATVSVIQVFERGE
jgi:hypothetical protein